MNWMRLGIAAILVNIGLLVVLVTITLWTVYSGQAQGWISEEVVNETLRQQVKQSCSADASVCYWGDQEMYNSIRPVLHQSFMIHSPSSGGSFVKMDIGAPTQGTTSLIQGFQLHDGDVYVPLSGNYLIHVDVTYFFRGDVDGSQVNVYVACTQSDSKVLVEIAQWCQIGLYCSLTYHGISFLSQGAIVYCEAGHVNEIITAVENTHISIVFY